MDSAKSLGVMSSSLFEVAAEIKPVKHGSPVFPSKLCHFLCPSIYPVFDNTLVKTGKIEYMGILDRVQEGMGRSAGKRCFNSRTKEPFPESDL